MGTAVKAMTDELRLTTAEKKLLKAMVDVENFDLNVQDTCAKADISTPTYYKARKKPYFNREYKRRSAMLVDGEIGEVVKALIREAKKGSARHIEMALEMAGLYSKDININKKSVNISLDGKDINGMCDEELIEFANGYNIEVDEEELIDVDDDSDSDSDSDTDE